MFLTAGKNSKISILERFFGKYLSQIREIWEQNECLPSKI